MSATHGRSDIGSALMATGIGPADYVAIERERLPISALACAGSVALATLSLLPIFLNNSWLGTSLLTVSLVTLVGALATWLRVPIFLVPIAQGIALFCVLVARFTSDGYLGFIPSPAALRSLRAVTGAGLAEIERFAPPVPVSAGVSAIAALGVGVVALVVYTLEVCLRLPAIAGIPLVALYVVPSLVLDSGAPWWTFSLVVAGWLVLLVTDQRTTISSWGHLVRSAGTESPSRALSGASSSAVRLGVLAAALALLVPVLIPGLTDVVLKGILSTDTGTGVSAGGSVTGIDPLVTLRRQVLNQPPGTLFRYRTDDPTPSYLRAAVLEDYSGDTWRVRPTDNAIALNTPGVIKSLAGPVFADASTRQYDFHAAALVSQYLPLPEHPVEISVDRSWGVNPATGAVAGLPGDSPGCCSDTSGALWQVSAVDGDPSPTQLRAGPVPSKGERATISASVPAFLVDTARTVTTATTSDYDAAVAIQYWFRTNFRYSTDIASQESSDYLQQFLHDRTGYCEQFAATMALMARGLGIPARVVVGFTPGTKDAEGWWTVTAKNAHAWPELFFPGTGWVRFEPTPRTFYDGGLTVPAYTEPAASSAGPAPAKPVVKPSTPKPSAHPSAVPISTGSSWAATADTWRQRGLVALLMFGLAALTLPAVLRLIKRRRRMSDGGVEAMWDELRDTALDLGLGWTESATPRQVAASVISSARLTGDAAEATTRLCRATEQSRYSASPPRTGRLTTDVRIVRRALLRRMDRSTRVRATLLPPSQRH